MSAPFTVWLLRSDPDDMALKGGFGGVWCPGLLGG